MKTTKNNYKGFLKLLVIVILFPAISYSCSKSSDTDTPGPNEVFIQSSSFNPSTITVSVNTTITWTNKDAIAHTVTSDNSLFDSGSLGSNATYSHQFSSAGTFNYHCTFHPTMLAKVIVQ